MNPSADSVENDPPSLTEERKTEVSYVVVEPNNTETCESIVDNIPTKSIITYDSRESNNTENSPGSVVGSDTADSPLLSPERWFYTYLDPSSLRVLDLKELVTETRNYSLAGSAWNVLKLY